MVFKPFSTTLLRLLSYYLHGKQINKTDISKPCVCAEAIVFRFYFSRYGRDHTKEYRLWHCASRTPNLSSLPDHGFEF